MSLPDLSLRRPVATWMAYCAIAVLGALSFLRLPIDLLPDVSFPTLSVWTSYADAGPAEVERFITEPIERSVSRVPGVREVTSRSRQGQSLVQLEFYWGTDMEFAMLHVRESLDNLGGLPESAERPVILSADPTSEPILSLAVTGGSLAGLRDLSEAVFKRRLEQLDGVALTAVTGGPEREIQVVVDPERLAIHGITIAEVVEALDRSNFSAPGGTIRRGRFQYSLRTLGEFESVAQLREVAVARPEGGGVVRLRDVAAVREGIAERETLTRYNAEPAIGLLVYKESGTNTVRVADEVREVLDQLRAEFPGVTIQVASSQADFIRAAIFNVITALVVGGALAFLVLFLFLQDPRYPVAIGLSIPISVLAAFALCYLFDVSLNVMSLGGLALGVGMLVDNSIVVLENIFRHREEGRGATESASVGARELAGAITAATLTTIAVFGPVLYVEGVAGALFADLSLAVAFSLLASIVVALTLLPVLAARFARAGDIVANGIAGATSDAAGPPSGPARVTSVAGGRWMDPNAEGPRAHGADVVPQTLGPDLPQGQSPSGRLRRAGRQTARSLGRTARSFGRLAGAVRRGAARGVRYVGASVRETFGDVGRASGRAVSSVTGPLFRRFDRRFNAFADRYRRALTWSLAHRSAVILLTVAVLAGAALMGAALPRSLMPPVDEGSFRVELELPVGTPIETTDEAAARLEDLLLGLEGVEAVFGRVGRAGAVELAAQEIAGLNSAAIDVRLAADAPPTPQVVERFRDAVVDVGIDPRFVAVETGRATSLGRVLGLGGADLAVAVRGEELPELIAVAESARARIDRIPRLADVRLDLQLTQPEVEIEVDRAAAARFGISVREVADAMENYLRGAITSRPYTEFAEKVAIRVSLPENGRRQLNDVLALTIEGVPLGELVEVRQGYGPVEIRRSEQRRAVRVLADVREGGLAAAVQSVEAALEGMPRPPLTFVGIGGANEEMRDSFRSLLFAFGLALLLVFLILAAEFESLVQPFVVLVSAPLAVLGAIPALWLAGDGFNVISGIGLVILVGIADNNAVVMVDFINLRREEGASKREAILDAGRLRLRPIMMTTITTLLGVLPMALGWGAGADLRAPLAVAILGGLVSSTLLILVVVPVVYSLLVAPGESVAPEAAAARAVSPGAEAATGLASG